MHPDPDLLRARVAVLANGDRAPLADAARHYAALRATQHADDAEWDVLYYLRQICLGQPVDREPRQALVRDRVLEPDGTVDPVMRAVVLSAVRGEDRVLHLASPFTDGLDRSLAEFVAARDDIRAAAHLGQLDGGQVKELFTGDWFGRGLDRLREKAGPPPREDPPPFSDRVRPPPPPSPGGPAGPS